MSASYTEGRPSLQWGNGRLGGGPNFETRPHAQVLHHLAYLVALSVLGWSDRPSNTFPLPTAPKDKNQSDSSLVNNFHTRFEPPAITKL